MSRLSKAGTLGVLIGVVGLLVTLMPFGAALEEKLGLEILFTLRGMRRAPADVVIVNIDKISSTRLNLPNDPEKWPRSLHARLTENLLRAGAAVIVFDIIFDEARTPADDQAFASAIRQAQNVVLFEYLSKETMSLIDKEGTATGTLHIENLVPPIPPLAQAAVALAPFPLPKVPIKVSRYWTFKAGTGDVPTLPVIALQIFTLDVYDAFLQLMKMVRPSQVLKLPQDKKAILTTAGVVNLSQRLRDFFANEPLAAKKMLQELNSPTFSSDPKKRRILKSLINMYQSPNSPYLNFYGPPGTLTTIPYYQMLQYQNGSPMNQRRIDLRNKVVFVGFSERFRPEQKDGFYTIFSRPNGTDLSGVEIAATAFANLLEDMPVRPFGLHGQLTLLFLWGLVVGGLFRLLPVPMAAASGLALGTFYLMAVQYHFTQTGVWYAVVTPVFLQLPLAFFGAVLWKSIDTNKERQNIKEAFGYYLPDRMIEQLAKNAAAIKTSSELVYGICLFTDVAQYTTFAEKMEREGKLEELGSLLNEYYATAFAPVRRHGGIISDVIGDAMLALWSSAQPDVSLREQACHAALDIAGSMERFKLMHKPLPDMFQLQTRVGLHAGSLLLGNVGALDHYEYRAVGDIVNTASRIEGLNKTLGTHILVSDTILDQLDGFLTRELGTFLLAGKSKPLAIHELICRIEMSTDQQRHLCARFSEAREAYRRQAWDEAAEKFYRVMRGHDDQKEDGPSRFYMQLCEQYRAHPPAETWDDVIQLVKK